MWANVFLYFMMLTLVVSAVSIHSMIKLDVTLTEGDSDRLQTIIEVSNALGVLCWMLYAASSIDVFEGNIYIIGAYPFVVATLAVYSHYLKNSIRRKKIDILDNNGFLPEFIAVPVSVRVIAYVQFIFTSVLNRIKNLVSSYASKAKADIEIEILRKTVIDLRMKLLARDIEIARAEDKANRFEKLWRESCLPASIKKSIHEELGEIKDLLSKKPPSFMDLTIQTPSELFDESDYPKPFPPKKP